MKSIELKTLSERRHRKEKERSALLIRRNVGQSKTEALLVHDFQSDDKFFMPAQDVLRNFNKGSFQNR